MNQAHPIGGTPLYAAALAGSHDSWRLRVLGCESDAAPAGGSGFTPARGALLSPHASWAQIGLADTCGNGGDVNAAQRGGSSVLHAAVQRKDETLVRLAIRKGADVAAVDDAGRTPHALAAELDAGAALLAGHATLPRDNRSSRKLLNASREVIEWPDISDIPFELQHETTGNSHFNLPRVRELIKSDKRLVFALSGDDELPIEACAHVGNQPIIRYHLDQGAPLSLPTAVSLGDHESVEFWLKRDPSLVHERGAHDFPLLWFAVTGGASIEIGERLLRHGTPIDQESMGSTALHVCVRRRKHDFAKWLLENGADPEIVGYRESRDGDTPLQLAAKDAKMVGLLKAAGARR